MRLAQPFVPRRQDLGPQPSTFLARPPHLGVWGPAPLRLQVKAGPRAARPGEFMQKSVPAACDHAERGQLQRRQGLGFCFVGGVAPAHGSPGRGAPPALTLWNFQCTWRGHARPPGTEPGPGLAGPKRCPRSPGPIPARPQVSHSPRTPTPGDARSPLPRRSTGPRWRKSPGEQGPGH